MKSLPRGLRNNNPGNIRITKDKWQGLREKQTDKEFFQFVEMKWGYRAPQTENNTGAYIRRVCQDMQEPSVYVPDIEDKDTMCSLAAAISYVENGVPAVMEDIYKGWDLL